MRNKVSRMNFRPRVNIRFHDRWIVPVYQASLKAKIELYLKNSLSFGLRGILEPPRSEIWVGG